jgi:hypothetical protein
VYDSIIATMGGFIVCHVFFGFLVNRDFQKIHGELSDPADLQRSQEEREQYFSEVLKLDDSKERAPKYLWNGFEAAAKYDQPSARPLFLPVGGIGSRQDLL